MKTAKYLIAEELEATRAAKADCERYLDKILETAPGGFDELIEAGSLAEEYMIQIRIHDAEIQQLTWVLETLDKAK